MAVRRDVIGQRLKRQAISWYSKGRILDRRLKRGLGWDVEV